MYIIHRLTPTAHIQDRWSDRPLMAESRRSFNPAVDFAVLLLVYVNLKLGYNLYS